MKTAADVAAAMGRDLPAPIRLDRAAIRREEYRRELAEWRTSDVAALVAKARAHDLIAGVGDRLALMRGQDALAGDTDRALGPGRRESR